MVKNAPVMRKIWVRSLGWEDPLEEGMATNSRILAWRIPVDRGAWQTTVHGVAKSQAQLIDWAQHGQFQCTSDFEKHCCSKILQLPESHVTKASPDGMSGLGRGSYVRTCGILGRASCIATLAMLQTRRLRPWEMNDILGKGLLVTSSRNHPG